MSLGIPKSHERTDFTTVKYASSTMTLTTCRSLFCWSACFLPCCELISAVKFLPANCPLLCAEPAKITKIAKLAGDTKLKNQVTWAFRSFQLNSHLPILSMPINWTWFRLSISIVQQLYLRSTLRSTDTLRDFRYPCSTRIGHQHSRTLFGHSQVSDECRICRQHEEIMLCYR